MANTYINQPRWKEPAYSKKEINDAGNIIRDPSSTEKKKALDIIDNWRAAHAYPLHVFYMNLRRKYADNNEYLVVERLKRLDSISAKLQREKGMQLFRMQDLGGCRVVVPTISDVYNVSKALQKSRIRHELKKSNDYINEPKLSGYRSLHLIYQFKTDTPEKEIYNKYPMLIEIQIRTHLQHIWSTAVETMGLFTNQALKSGQGKEEIKRFFVLVSSIFAILEKQPIVPNTTNDITKLKKEIKAINKNFHVLDTLSAIKVAIDHEKNKPQDKHGYYILQLNYEEHCLNSWFFMPSEFEKANKFYDYLEETKDNHPLDTVLVRSASYNTVRNAYPNYFLDIGEFIDLVREYT